MATKSKSPTHVKIKRTEVIEVSDTESVSSPKKPEPTNQRLTDAEIKLFNSITNFVDDVASYLSTAGKAIPAVARYNELLRKTRLIHKKNIRKHIDAFKAFIHANGSHIKSKDMARVTGDIRFSDNVYLNINDIVKRCDEDSQKVIIEHLLNIQYQFNPTDEIKTALMELIQHVGADGNQQGAMATQTNPGNPLSGIFSLIEQNVDKNDPNPMSQIMKMLGSPAFGQIVNEVKRTAENGGLSQMLSMLGQGTPQ